MIKLVKDLSLEFFCSGDIAIDLARLGGLLKRLTLHDPKIDSEFRFSKINKTKGSVQSEYMIGIFIFYVNTLALCNHSLQL